MRKFSTFSKKKDFRVIGLRVGNAQDTVQKWDDREGSQRPEAKPDIWLLTFSPRG